MARSRAEYLLNKLIDNRLSRRELDELLDNMGQDEMNEEYSHVLENYFNQLLSEQENEEVPEPKKEDSPEGPNPQERNRTTKFSLRYPRRGWGTWLSQLKVPSFLVAWSW
ncbi:hypothetical protein GCM10027275_21880 [Rhabdobacter roseus]|uniref:Uncharacterized protein n=1 Tax=Rhabdobacter roseus TaxID=1655419 RepID=A0A840TL29_9BACT|nr:hypothetical protein [Rhabdobacter roseus]MBB5284124.1 hypothetical protein [Rhabdobacter roseus]